MTPEGLRALLARPLREPATSDDTGSDNTGPVRQGFGGPLPGIAPVPAAVLVPIILGPVPSVLLTKRTAHLTKHAGQVSFPGGRIDPEDEDAEAAALREAAEEIGLHATRSDILGRLPDHLTGTNYRITPVVALLPGDFQLSSLVPSPQEVELIFTYPLADVLNPALPQRMSAMWQGRQREYFELPHAEHRVWGVTARILMVLGARLREAF